MKKTQPTPEALRVHYAKTALARMGIPFEAAMWAHQKIMRRRP